MEQSEIVAGNTLIHDWMGVKRMKPPFQDEWIGQEKAEDLKYHSSWDWLMGVVLKIESLENSRFGFYIDTHGVEVFDYKESEKLIAASLKYDDGDTKIFLIWDAVLQFIKWYNSQPVKP